MTVEEYCGLLHQSFEFITSVVHAAGLTNLFLLHVTNKKIKSFCRLCDYDQLNLAVEYCYIKMF